MDDDLKRIERLAAAGKISAEDKSVLAEALELRRDLWTRDLRCPLYPATAWEAWQRLMKIGLMGFTLLGPLLISVLVVGTDHDFGRLFENIGLALPVPTQIVLWCGTYPMVVLMCATAYTVALALLLKGRTSRSAIRIAIWNLVFMISIGICIIGAYFLPLMALMDSVSTWK